VSTVARNVARGRDPERFHTDKSCICQVLEYLAEQCDARSDPKITVSRLRRSTSGALIGGRRVTVQRHRDPFFTSMRQGVFIVDMLEKDIMEKREDSKKIRVT
jgi:hypothetical protein